MNKKIAIRTAIGLVAIVAMVIGYSKFSEWTIDPEFDKTYQTAGYIAALENTEQGTKAVLFNPAGEKTDAAGYREGSIDQEIVWDKGGNHIYVSSNRGGSTFGIYRWTPTTNTFDSRSLNNSSVSGISFGNDEVVDPDKSGLVVSGGKVYKYFPKIKEVNLLLSAVFDPRAGQSRDQAVEGGSSNLGTGFREAHWTKDRQAIYTIMSQEDGSEAIVVHYPEIVDDKGRPKPPYPIFLGDRVQIQVAKNGVALVAVQNFRFRGADWQTPAPDADSVKLLEGKNALIYLDLDQNLTPGWQPMIITPETNQLLWDVALAPSGEEFAAILGDIKDGQDFYPKMLVLSPMRPPSPQNPPSLTPILEGGFSRPSWSPDGTKLVMLRDEPDGKRSVVTVNKDGSDVTRMSKEGLDYEAAFFSPQTQSP